MSKEFTVRIYKNTGKAYEKEETKVVTLEEAVALVESTENHAWHIYDDQGATVKHGWGAWATGSVKTAIAVTPEPAPVVEPVAEKITTTKKKKAEPIVEAPAEPLVPTPTPEPEAPVADVVEKVEEPIVEAPTEQPAE